jgi:peptide/nickel transport system permease protein
MVTYVIRRLLLVPVLLVGVTVLIFAMLQFLTPVERSALYVRDFPKNERQLDGIILKYGLDKPLYEQYWRWLVGTTDPVTGDRNGGILFGDFGWSRTGGQPVAKLIQTRFPNTLDLTLWAVGPVILVASGWGSRQRCITTGSSTRQDECSASSGPPSPPSSSACWY